MEWCNASIIHQSLFPLLRPQLLAQHCPTHGAAFAATRAHTCTTRSRRPADSAAIVSQRLVSCSLSSVCRADGSLLCEHNTRAELNERRKLPCYREKQACWAAVSVNRSLIAGSTSNKKKKSKRRGWPPGPNQSEQSVGFFPPQSSWQHWLGCDLDIDLTSLVYWGWLTICLPVTVLPFSPLVQHRKCFFRKKLSAFICSSK